MFVSLPGNANKEEIRASTGKGAKTKARRRKPVVEPVMGEPKTLMQRIFENQRAELDRLNEELRAKVTGERASSRKLWSSPWCFGLLPFSPYAGYSAIIAWLFKIEPFDSIAGRDK
jgi:hypothetical protein